MRDTLFWFYSCSSSSWTTELGINVDHIITKAKSVMNPFSSFPSTFAEEADMSGPIAFCLALGIILSLSGKFQFGVIYGLAITGCVSIYVVLNLMSEGGIDLYRCTSVVGYALLPMVVLSVSMLFRPGKYVWLAHFAPYNLDELVCSSNVLFFWQLPVSDVVLPCVVAGLVLASPLLWRLLRRKVAVLGYLVGSLSITWSTATATKIFVSVLSMQVRLGGCRCGVNGFWPYLVACLDGLVGFLTVCLIITSVRCAMLGGYSHLDWFACTTQDQMWLIAYPLALLYTSFALIIIF